MAAFQYKETKSREQSKILLMNLIFMSLNMIFLPMTGLVSIKDFLDYFIGKEFDLIEEMSSHMGQMAAFFATYIMQTTFVFNCI